MKLNTVDLNRLHVFRTVAESASMREAGRRLLRTPSAISQSVGNLEKELGLRLFTRAGIRLELTDAGRRVLRQVKANERGLQEVLEELSVGPTEVRGRVALGMPPGYPAVSLGPAIGAVLLRHPELQLRLRFLPHRELAKALRAGRLEMALSLQPLRAWSRRLRSVKLRDEDLVLAIPPRFRHLAGGISDELPVVDYYQKPLLIEGWARHHDPRGARKVRARIRVYAANLEHVLELVQRGVGCAVVPRHVVERHLLRGELLEHALDRRRPWRVSVWMNAQGRPEELTQAGQAAWTGLLGSRYDAP